MNDLKILIITDLDGSLLDPETYTFEKAKPTLNIIKERNIPLVICSSKTKTEIEYYRKLLYNKEPFISENGGGIFINKDYFNFEIDGIEKDGYKVITIGKPYSILREAFLEIKKELNIDIIGFGDMTVDQLSKATGITEKEANFAKDRYFDEPFIFKGTDTEKKNLFATIEKHGFYCTEGNLFHILGKNDKGKAARIILDFYTKTFGNFVSIGIGDGLNDLPLLKEVDYPVLIPKLDGHYVNSNDNIPNIIKANYAGPEGWSESVGDILRRI